MPTNISGQAPTQFLVSTIKFATTSVTQYVTDPTSPFVGFPKAYRADFDVQVQTHSDPTTNTPYQYDAFDINIGDWLGQNSGKAYKIIDIIVNDPADVANYDPGQPDAILDQTNITLEIEDVDLYILKSDTSSSGSNSPEEDQAGVIFETDEEDMPILSNITQLAGAFPNISYWVQDLQSRFEFYSVDVEGVPTDVDNDKAVASNTVGNNASTGLAIEHTPFADSKVTLKINGLEASYGMSKDFYFSNDGGLTARAMADIEAGDELYWNGTNAGYDLEPTDDIDIDYEAASTDL
jgi:hypothetical protein